jgi:Holliday junction resolvasome RuvABC DNA-binding subunit
MEAALGHNILQSAASMKGSLSDKDLSFLRGLSGVGSKSSDARNQILTDAKDKLEREIAKSKKQQADVLAGRYREKTLTQGTE